MKTVPFLRSRFAHTLTSSNSSYYAARGGLCEYVLRHQLQLECACIALNSAANNQRTQDQKLAAILYVLWPLAHVVVAKKLELFY